jgi:DNA-binding FadR family transcriptional regulator
MAKPRTTRSTTAAAEVMRLVAAAYLDGQLPAGARLPGERDLAARFGVSRATVREALGRLEAMGALERRKGSGTYLAPDRRADAGLSPETVLEARLAVEPFLAYLAAMRATPAEVVELEAIAVAAEAPDASFEVLDGRFHLEIARLARNEVLLDLAERLHSARAGELWGSLKERVLRRAGRRRTYERQHRAILAAIAARDGQGASEAMRRHVETVRQDMLAPPDGTPGEF